MGAIAAAASRLRVAPGARGTQPAGLAAAAGQWHCQRGSQRQGGTAGQYCHAGCHKRSLLGVGWGPPFAVPARNPMRRLRGEGCGPAPLRALQAGAVLQVRALLVSFCGITIQCCPAAPLPCGPAALCNTMPLCSALVAFGMKVWQLAYSHGLPRPAPAVCLPAAESASWRTGGSTRRSAAVPSERLQCPLPSPPNWHTGGQGAGCAALLAWALVALLPTLCRPAVLSHTL